MNDTVILALGCGLILAAPVVHRLVIGRFDPFEPIVMFALAWGAMFTVRPIAIVARDDTLFYGTDIGEALPRAVLLGGLGAAGFLTGYHSPAGSWLISRIRLTVVPRSSRSAALRAGVVAALGIGAFLVLLLNSTVPDPLGVFLRGRSAELDQVIEESSVYVWWGSLLVVPAALAAVALATRERRWWSTVLAVLLMLIVLVRALPAGNRIVLLVLVGALIVFRYLRAQRRPGLRAILALLVVAALLSSAVLAFRYPESRGDVASVLRGATPGTLFRPVTQGPDAEMSAALAGALTVIPDELGYRYGRASVGELAIRAIPRRVWAGKPRPPSITVVETVWPEARERGKFDPAFTPLMSFFWDFGLAGVAVGMALLGALARYGYLVLTRFPKGHVVQITYAASLLFLVVALRVDIVMTVSQAVLLVVPIPFILARITRRRGP